MRCTPLAWLNALLVLQRRWLGKAAQKLGKLALKIWCLFSLVWRSHGPISQSIHWNHFQEILGIRDFETIPPCSDGKFLGFHKPVADMNVVLPTAALVCWISNLRQPSNQKPKSEGQWLDNKGVTLHIRFRCGFSLPRHLYITVNWIQLNPYLHQASPSYILISPTSRFQFEFFHATMSETDWFYLFQSSASRLPNANISTTDVSVVGGKAIDWVL